MRALKFGRKDQTQKERRRKLGPLESSKFLQLFLCQGGFELKNQDEGYREGEKNRGTSYAIGGVANVKALHSTRKNMGTRQTAIERIRRGSYNRGTLKGYQ